MKFHHGWAPWKNGFGHHLKKSTVGATGKNPSDANVDFNSCFLEGLGGSSPRSSRFTKQFLLAAHHGGPRPGKKCDHAVRY